jgi:predicted ATPase
VQETAYQSLLKSRRQHLHQQVARVLEAQFAQSVETQPELVAHHYTEAGLLEQAIPYWQRAGQRASDQSTNVEAIRYFTTGIELLKKTPDSLDRAQTELALQTALGAPLQTLTGWGDSSVATIYDRALELCQQIGDTPYLFPTLFGLWRFYLQRAQMQTVLELAERLLNLAQQQQDASLLMEAHRALASTLFFIPDFAAAKSHS